MATIVLHHYETSPFAEVARLALGLKALAYRSVIIPNVSPKPELSALTGGYERTPVMQHGADIFCDTAMIMDALEELAPEPSLYPPPTGFAGRMVALYAGGQAFMPAVAATLGAIADQIPDAFWEDRGRRFGLKRETYLPIVPHLGAQFLGAMAMLEESLADGRAFIGGAAPGHADLAFYQLVWFQRMRGRQPADFGAHIGSWAARIAAIGHGEPEDWSGADAIDHAAGQEPKGGCTVADGTGFAAGQSVRVKTESPDPAYVEGRLVGLSHRSITVEREGDRAGRVHVHFPRLGQVLTPV